jgi:hypothetical protein
VIYYYDYGIDSLYGYREKNEAEVIIESAAQRFNLGTIIRFENGDEWIYCKNGAGILAPGKVIQSEAYSASAFSDLAVNEPVVGGTQFVVTTGAGGDLTADVLKDGTIHVNDDTGEGYIYRIKANTACAALGATTITIYGTIAASLGANSTVTLIKNKCYGVILTPTTPTGHIIGVPQRQVTANYYFWAKKQGYSAVLTDGTLVIGDECGISNAVAGAVEPNVATQAVIGRVVNVNVTTEYSCVELTL